MPRFKYNEYINYPEVRVVLPDGGAEIMSINEALQKAEEYDLDLVLISENAKPPVCKIIDRMKYKYELEKKLKEQKKHQRTSHLKEIRFRPQTGEHDYQTKLKHIIEFLQHKNKVRINIFFKGREIVHSNLGMELVEKIKKDLEYVGELENTPRLEGRSITLIFSPLSAEKLNKKKKEEEEKKEEGEKENGKSKD